MIAQARADGIPEAWLEAARQSPIWKMAMEWKVAFPLHPEYRTLPMVWYVPPLSPIQSAAEAGKMGIDGDMPDVQSLRIPLQYLANLLTAGDEEPVALGLERMLAMRAYMRAKTVDGVIDEAIARRVGLTGAADRGDVPHHGDRQLRGSLRHPDDASRGRRGRLRAARRVRLLLRRWLLAERRRRSTCSAASSVKNDKPKMGALLMKTLKVLSALLSYPTDELHRRRRRAAQACSSARRVLPRAERAGAARL